MRHEMAIFLLKKTLKPIVSFGEFLVCGREFFKKGDNRALVSVTPGGLFSHIYHKINPLRDENDDIRTTNPYLLHAYKGRRLVLHIEKSQLLSRESHRFLVKSTAIGFLSAQRTLDLVDFRVKFSPANFLPDLKSFPKNEYNIS